MGKKLDALLGRGFKTKKFKATVNHTISRLTVIKRQHQARCSVARSDVMQILQLGQHERALLRVEQVVKEQNLLDVFTMLEIYCHLLIEKAMLLHEQMECPEELKEAISSMIYASTRCGQLPELQELRAVFTSRFGKEFEAHATQQSNNCNINPKMIQKLSNSMPCMAIKLKMLKGIARESNITLQIDVADSVYSEVESVNKDLPEAKISNSSEDFNSGIGEPIVTEDEGIHDRFPDSANMPGIYKDRTQMAEAAFRSSGSHGADTAEAAVEQSWPDTHDSIDLRSHGLKPCNIADSAEITEEKNSRVKELKLNVREAVYPLQYYIESEDDKMHAGNKLDLFKQHEEETYLDRCLSISSVRSADMTLNDESLKEEGKTLQGKFIFDDSDYDIVNGGRLLLFEEHIANSNRSHTLHTTKILSS